MTAPAVAGAVAKMAEPAARPGRPPAIVLDGVAVRRGQRMVLHDISLTVPTAAITAIVGPSGAGKSTLLGALNGLIEPAAGTITVTGLGRIDDPRILLQHRRGTATVFQEHALIDRLTALDNVLLGLADRRHPLSPLPWPRDLRRQAAEALGTVGLLGAAGVRAGRLSGGERQRVGIARALVRRPVLLLGDEPFSAVDPALTRSLADTLHRAVARTGLTVLLVLHQLATARVIADRIIGLAQGRVIFAGSPAAFDAAAEARLYRTAIPFRRAEALPHAEESPRSQEDQLCHCHPVDAAPASL